ALNRLVERVFELLAGDEDVLDLYPDFVRQLALVKRRVEGDCVEVRVKEDLLLGMMVPAVRRLTEAGLQAAGKKNLLAIAIAFNNCHDAMGALPARAIYNKQGKPLLSWRVHLLPFMEEDELYREFKLDEPWDSEHNKKLIPRMPKWFAGDLKLAAEGKTTYLVPAGKNTAFDGMKRLKFLDVTDGASNTLLMVDVDDEHAVTWTKPNDWEFDPKAPTRGLRKHEG